MNNEIIPTKLQWAAALRPVGAPHRARLSLSSELSAWHITVEFELWKQPPGAPALNREETYGWKAQILGSDGSRSVGEVELAQRLRRSGLRAYWIDTFGSAPATWRTFIAKRDQLPGHVADLLARIRGSGRGKQGGSPDVVAWEEGSSEVVFVEYKGPKDSIRPGQDEWLRSALQVGVPDTAYVVARWLGPAV